MRKIILTGATGGLGKALTGVICEHNKNELICVYRNKDKFSLLCEQYEKLTGYMLSKEDDFEGLFSVIFDEKPDSIALVLNAFSISPIKRIGDMSTEEIAESVYGNVIRNYLLINKTVNYCKTNNLGLRIINLDSGAADYPLTGWANYCASKAFMNSLLAVVAKENPDYQVVSVDPGVINTDMQAEIRATEPDVFEQVSTFIDYEKNGVLKSPEEVARQIADNYLYNWRAELLREKLK